jgi:hypothetical protein
MAARGGAVRGPSAAFVQSAARATVCNHRARSAGAKSNTEPPLADQSQAAGVHVPVELVLRPSCRTVGARCRIPGVRLPHLGVRLPHIWCPAGAHLGFGCRIWGFGCRTPGVRLPHTWGSAGAPGHIRTPGELDPSQKSWTPPKVRGTAESLAVTLGSSRRHARPFSQDSLHAASVDITPPAFAFDRKRPAAAPTCRAARHQPCQGGISRRRCRTSGAGSRPSITIRSTRVARRGRGVPSGRVPWARSAAIDR